MMDNRRAFHVPSTLRLCCVAAVYLCQSLSNAFTLHAPPLSCKTRSATASCGGVTALLSSVGDDVPSDYDPGDVMDVDEKVLTVDVKEEDSSIRDELKRELLLLATVTNRGECATNEERDILVDLVTQLEALNPTVDPTSSSCRVGEWDLVLASTQFFRSSPFFMAVRNALRNSPEIATTGFDLHDRATSSGRIGRVRQTITGDDELVSEVELTVGLTPGLPVVVKGTVVTTADLEVVSPEAVELRIKNTRVTKSNVPFLNQFLDDASFLEMPMGDMFERITGSPSVSVLKTYYMDQGIRISRDEDDNFFVYARA